MQAGRRVDRREQRIDRCGLGPRAGRYQHAAAEAARQLAGLAAQPRPQPARRTHKGRCCRRPGRSRTGAAGAPDAAPIARQHRPGARRSRRAGAAGCAGRWRPRAARTAAWSPPGRSSRPEPRGGRAGPAGVRPPDWRRIQRATISLLWCARSTTSGHGPSRASERSRSTPRRCSPPSSSERGAERAMRDPLDLVWAAQRLGQGQELGALAGTRRGQHPHARCHARRERSRARRPEPGNLGRARGAQGGGGTQRHHHTRGKRLSFEAGELVTRHTWRGVARAPTH